MWVAEITKPGAHLVGKNAYWIKAPAEAQGHVNNLLGTTVKIEGSLAEVIAATALIHGELREGDTIGIVVQPFHSVPLDPTG